MMALMIAAMTPKKLRMMARTLNNPPLTFGINADMIPKTPNTNAINARMSPKNAPE